jgi:hypothetical protein
MEVRSFVLCGWHTWKEHGDSSPTKCGMCDFVCSGHFAVHSVLRHVGPACCVTDLGANLPALHFSNRMDPIIWCKRLATSWKQTSMVTGVAGEMQYHDPHFHWFHSKWLLPVG